jgi:hypothetical protein
MTAPEGGAQRLGWWQHAAVFLFAYLILVMRRPDALFHAQFCAEDGLVWFPDAYNHGWLHALLMPWTGIFMTVPRLVASLALLVPLSEAPLLTNTIHIALQALPVSLLLSSRSQGWGTLRFRALLAVVYLALPDCSELSYGISWAQWPLALCAFLVVVALPPRNRMERIADCALFVLAGLSGPSCILLLVIASVMWWQRRESWRLAPCGIFALCAMTQAYALLVLDPKGRPTQFPLGASLAMFTRIYSGNVLLGALLGRTRFAIMQGPGAMAFLVCVAVAGLALLGWVMLKAELELKLFIVFTGMLLFVSLVRPTAYPEPGKTVWQLLAEASDIRYWVLPSLAFAWSLVWFARNGRQVMKVVSLVLLCVMGFGAAINWEHPGLKDLHFAEYVKAFDDAPAGTVVIIPENPNPAKWTMRLVKHTGR